MSQNDLIEPSALTQEITKLASRNGASRKVLKYLRAGAPYACYQALQDSAPSEQTEEQGYYSGKSANRRRTVFGIEMATDGLEETCLRQLPLNGHVAVASWGVFSWVDEALSALEKRDKGSLDYIMKWCRLIVWLRKTEDSKLTELTSVAIPSMPFGVFISRKAIRHIPPKTIINHVGLYALQENIFHECAHQELSAFLLCNDLLIAGGVTDHEISIPWRNTSWPIDRALHAAFVYSKLNAFRHRALKGSQLHPEETLAIRTAQESGKAALEHLTTQLKHACHLLTPAGERILSLVSGR